MTPPTPSPGALRAAKRIHPVYSLDWIETCRANKTTLLTTYEILFEKAEQERNRLANIIDAETGAAELAEALRRIRDGSYATCICADIAREALAKFDNSAVAMKDCCLGTNDSAIAKDSIAYGVGVV